jgi:hypothetical protein
MNEIELIKIKGEQPVAKISNAELEFLIERDFSNNIDLIKQKLNKIQSNSQDGKKRIGAAVLKLANSDLNKIDYLINKANEDFRDVVSEAEYPRASIYGFEEPNEKELKTYYLNDWSEYMEWKNKGR